MNLKERQPIAPVTRGVDLGSCRVRPLYNQHLSQEVIQRRRSESLLLSGAAGADGLANLLASLAF